jgi:hypothetical protein
MAVHAVAAPVAMAARARTIAPLQPGTAETICTSGPASFGRRKGRPHASPAGPTSLHHEATQHEAGMAFPNDGAPVDRDFAAYWKARANSPAVRDAIENGLPLRRAIGLLCDRFMAKEIRRAEIELAVAVREFQPSPVNNMPFRHGMEPELRTFVEGDPARAADLVAARDRAWGEGLRSVLARLASGHLQAVGRHGGLHGPWRRIAMPEWFALEVVNLQAGHVRAGVVEYWDVRAADPNPIPLDVAFRAFGNPPDVEWIDVLNHYARHRALGPHEAESLSWRMGMLRESLRERLAAGDLQGQCDGESQLPDNWAEVSLDLLVSTTKLPGREMASNVTLSMPLRAADASQNNIPDQVRKSRKRERIPDTELIKEMHDLVHPEAGKNGILVGTAAGIVCVKAQGGGTDDSKKSRLFKKYKTEYPEDIS